MLTPVAGHLWVFAIIGSKIKKCTRLGNTVKEVVATCDKTFLGGEGACPLHSDPCLTTLLASRERSPTAIFVQVGSDTSWHGHLAQAEQPSPSFRTGPKSS